MNRDTAVATFAIISTLSACVQIAGIEEPILGEGGAGGESFWTSSAGGASSSSATSSSSASSSSSTSSSSSSSSGGSCSESPCRLVAPQCGCSAGEMCSVDNAGNRMCVPAGMIALGADCSQGACAPGGWCGKTTPTISTCQKFCASDANCTAPGGLCLNELPNGSSGSIPGVKSCTENCDPTTSVGCPVSGTGCEIAQESGGQMRYFTRCAGSGAGTQGSACMTNSNCAATYGCFDTGGPANECLKYCIVNLPSCPAGTTCTSLQATIGSTEYGACL